MDGLRRGWRLKFVVLQKLMSRIKNPFNIKIAGTLHSLKTEKNP